MTPRFFPFLVIGCLPAIAEAQRITITPIIAAYVPLVPQYKATTYSDQFCEGEPCGLLLDRIALQPAAALGVAVTARVHRSLGIEASLATARPERQTVLRTTPTNAPQILTAKRRSTVATLRATVQRRIGSMIDLSVGLGASRTTLSGERLGDRTFPGVDKWGASAAASVGSSITSRTRFTLSLVDNIYPMESFMASGVSRALQHDLLVSMGVGLVL